MDEQSNHNIIEEIFGSSGSTDSDSSYNSDDNQEPTVELPVQKQSSDEPSTIEIPLASENKSTEQEDDEEEVKIFSAKARKKRPSSSAFHKEDDTTTIKVNPHTSISESIAKHEKEEEIQLKWDHWDEPEEQQEEGTSPEGDRALVEAFHKSRESKIKAFKLLHSISSEVEDSSQIEEVVEDEQFEEEFMDDFCQYEDSETIDSELRYRSSKCGINLGITLVLEFLLFLQSICFQLGILSDSLVFIISSAVVLIIMLLCNLPLLHDGFSDIGSSEWSLDSFVSITSCFAVLHTGIQLIQPDYAAFGLLPCVAGLNLALASAARAYKSKRILQNFHFVSQDQPKWAAEIITNAEAAEEIGHTAVSSGVPSLTFFRQVPFLYQFLSRSYHHASEYEHLKKPLFLSWAFALVASVLFGLLSELGWIAFQLFGACIVFSIPAALAFTEQHALFKTSVRATKAGGAVIGSHTVQKFGDSDAVILHAIDLFKDENMLLHGIRTFRGTHIDDAILDTASLVVEAGGPLSYIFRRIIEDKQNMLKSVDALVYEQDMGLTGWVDSRRVLVGNRKLLQNHGVDVPSLDYEERYTKNNRQLVYLSVAGSLSAMFIVSYTKNEEIAEALAEATKEDVTFLIDTCDPNITESFLCDIFDLDPYYVETLGGTARRRYENLVVEQKDSDTAIEPVADLAGEDTLLGKLVPLSLCKRLRHILPQINLLSLILALLGMLLTIIFVFVSQTMPTTIYMVIYIIATFLISYLYACIRKI